MIRAQVWTRSVSLLVAFWISLVPALATGNVFTVDRWPVDASGESAADARGVALARGRVQALHELLQRLSPREYWQSIPPVPPSDVIDLISGIQINNEKTSPTRYLAEVSYSFKPLEIRNILRDAYIPFSESQAREAIVLPVFETEGRYLLWEEDNEWSRAWQERFFINELVPLISALGELEDIVGVTAGDAISRNRSALIPFAARYGVGDVMVAHATLGRDETTELLKITLFRVAATGSGEFGDRSIDFIIRNTDRLPLEDLLNFAIDQAVARLREDWKFQTIIRIDGVPSELLATVRFTEHREWVAIRNRLNEMPTINDLEVVALSTTGAEIVLHYVGTLSQLRLNMAQRNLNLLDGGSYGLIALREDLPIVESEELEGGEALESGDDGFENSRSTDDVSFERLPNPFELQ